MGDIYIITKLKDSLCDGRKLWNNTKRCTILKQVYPQEHCFKVTCRDTLKQRYLEQSDEIMTHLGGEEGRQEGGGWG